MPDNHSRALVPPGAPGYARGASSTPISEPESSARQGAKRLSSQDGQRFTPHQASRLLQIRERLIEARRELDALIGDAYLRPRASIVPVHFLDLASAVEKLRWAEKEWRELDTELTAEGNASLEELVEVGTSEGSAG